MLPLLGLPALSFLPTLDAIAVEKKKNSDKALIVIWLGGGPTQCETFDAHDDTIEASRSVTGVIDTNVSGLQLGGSFTRLATLADRFSLVRGVNHPDANHDSATHYNMTGYMTVASDMAPSKEPSIGSIISRTHGSNSPLNGIPHYVKANAIRHDGPAWMGIVNDGFLANEDGIKNLGLNSTEERFKARLNFISKVEESNQLSNHPLMRGWSDLRGQAGKVIIGSAADAFRINKEKPEVQAKYGVDKSGLGRNLLLARRLIQNGTKVVTIHHGGWDNHTDIKNAMGNIAVELDLYTSILLEELKSLGMEKDVMVVVTGEFGRTRFNATGGRDHNPAGLSVLIAGGDYNHGKVIGKTQKDHMAPMDKGIHPLDITATMFDHFGLPTNTIVVDNAKRPKHLIDGEHSCIL